jgi:hypothetical protein
LLTLQSWQWKPHVTPKHRFVFNGLYGVIPQKIELFTTLRELRRICILVCDTLCSPVDVSEECTASISTVEYILGEKGASWALASSCAIGSQPGVAIEGRLSVILSREQRVFRFFCF